MHYLRLLQITVEVELYVVSVANGGARYACPTRRGGTPASYSYKRVAATVTGISP
jgi:hypothetical protein